MPKIRENTVKLREMRIKTSKQKSLLPPSEIYLCVLGNGATGSPRCLYMFSDHSRYLFNVGEGSQRLAHEYKMKLSKLEHIFVTHASWENLGGLLGLSLTIQDIGVPQLTLHGPDHLESIYDCTKSFVITKGMHIDVQGTTNSPFVDNCVEIHSVPIFASSAKDINMIQDCCKSPSKMHMEKKAKMTDLSNVAVAYICKGHSKKGQLLLQKCLELGVPNGPLLGELKNGKDVVLPNGKVVRSADVVSPDEPCPVFLVVECPSEKYLDAFVSEETLRSCQNPARDTLASLIVHFTPSTVLHMDKYQEWMKSFPESTCHLLLNEECTTTTSIAVHRVQHMLNILHPGIFSLLYENHVENCMDSTHGFRIPAKTLYRYHLRPNKGFDKSCAVEVEPDAYIQEAKNTPGFLDSLNSLHVKLQQQDEPTGQLYPEVVFLGTGSCIPSKVRNVSCILVNLSPTQSIFLDCGEGSYNQLWGLYGKQNSQEILRKVHCIFISHMHADHHLGLFTLLKQRNEAFSVRNKKSFPVTIIAPQCIGSWLQDYSEKFESLTSFYEFIDCRTLEFSNKAISNGKFSMEHLNILENVELSTVPVLHCPNAYGIVLTSTHEWKIVYSGDTIPCQSLVEAGKDCSLLIHEATMEDDLEDEAALKMHSTTSQAISIAEQMNAQYTLLTHFSQRYAKVPLFSESFHSRVGCAFDNMRVRMCDLPILSMFLPTLHILFAENVEKLVDKSNKRKEKLNLYQ